MSPRFSHFGWRTISGGITAARGYLAAGVASGIKAKGLDLAVVFSTQESLAAAVFTRNQVQAAPVLLSKKHLRHSHGRIRAVLMNSGCANACTGENGMSHAVSSARAVGAELGIDPYRVVVGSTGVIGYPLPIEKLLKGIPVAVAALKPDGGDAALRAIMTTDTVPKSSAVEGKMEGKTVRIGGMVKGAGMIHPNMATMLSVITTDARISRRQMDRILRRVVDRTFHCLTVDGDTSTNDMVILLSNSASDCQVETHSAASFEEGLELVCGELARSVARDAEGATKFVEIIVEGAISFVKARQVAKTIAHSPLVKTALFGEELNWGRILCAAGYSGVKFDPNKVELRVSGIPIVRKGVAVDDTRARAEQALKSKDVQILLHLNGGRYAARVWTCDLGHGYVNINGSYIS